MTGDRALYDSFLSVWPPERVRAMSIEEYTAAGSKDSFTYWIEFKLDKLGSIAGGSSFKFGIYSRHSHETRQGGSGRMYNETYAWMEKYGKTPEEAFRSVKREVVKVIEAARKGDLSAIDTVDLGQSYKWKIAYHYQPSIDHPICFDIFSRDALVFLTGLDRNAKLSKMQERLAHERGEEDPFGYADRLWMRYTAATGATIATDSETGFQNLNTIFYGPPGTGKTFEVLERLKAIEADRSHVRNKTTKKTLDTSRTFWHIAPGMNGYLWPQLRKGTRLGYEWCSTSLGDLKALPPTTSHYDIIRRFSDVRKGDVFVVISGRKVLALAEAKHDYDFQESTSSAWDFQTVEVDWVEQFDIPILLNTSQTMSFCILNGGRRWEPLLTGLHDRGYLFSDDKHASDSLLLPTYLWVTFHQSYSYEDFIEGIKPVMEEEDDASVGQIGYAIDQGVFYQACDFACQNAGYPDLNAALIDTPEGRRERFAQALFFYLVIDEINRGNVANIFGELITLIEADKRLGNKNELIVHLPYSKMPFGVPPNLSLIGTMNTADRSIEALDSALRRRFSFVEYPPRPEKIETPDGFEVDLARLLVAINDRIKYLLDRDHQIGHSYFMGIYDSEEPSKALRETFERSIIPQLEEYFYGAPERIGMILGKDFVKEKQGARLLSIGEESANERTVYEITVPEDLAAFRRLYE